MYCYYYRCTYPHLCINDRLNLWRHNWSSAVDFYHPPPLYELMQYYNVNDNVTKWERAFPRQCLYSIIYRVILSMSLSGLRSLCLMSWEVCSLCLPDCLVVIRLCIHLYIRTINICVCFPSLLLNAHTVLRTHTYQRMCNLVGSMYVHQTISFTK